MHDCPNCGMACDCDGEDTYGMTPPDCTHCEDEDMDDFDTGDGDSIRDYDNFTDWDYNR